MSFPDLVADPEPVIAKLAELLPGRLTPAPAVAACVKPALFRTAGEPDQSTGSIDRINRSDQSIGSMTAAKPAARKSATLRV